MNVPIVFSHLSLFPVTDGTAHAQTFRRCSVFWSFHVNERQINFIVCLFHVKFVHRSNTWHISRVIVILRWALKIVDRQVLKKIVPVRKVKVNENMLYLNPQLPCWCKFLWIIILLKMFHKSFLNWRRPKKKFLCRKWRFALNKQTPQYVTKLSAMKGHSHFKPCV